MVLVRGLGRADQRCPTETSAIVQQGQVQRGGERRPTVQRRRRCVCAGEQREWWLGVEFPELARVHR